MDVEEIILEHIGIREWADKFAKETLKNQSEKGNNKKSACNSE